MYKQSQKFCSNRSTMENTHFCKQCEKNAIFYGRLSAIHVLYQSVTKLTIHFPNCWPAVIILNQQWNGFNWVFLENNVTQIIECQISYRCIWGLFCISAGLQLSEKMFQISFPKCWLNPPNFKWPVREESCGQSCIFWNTYYTICH